MAIKNTKRNARSIYWIKYVTCGKVLQDLKFEGVWGELESKTTFAEILNKLHGKNERYGIAFKHFSNS